MLGELGMACRPEDAAESETGSSENELGTRKRRLGGAEESKARVRGRARRSTTLGRRRSAPPRRGWGGSARDGLCWSSWCMCVWSVGI